MADTPSTGLQLPGKIPRRRLFLVLILSGLIVTGGFVWLVWLHDPPPVPPDIDLVEAEPEVAKVIEEARAEVVKSRRSGEAWGHLGMILLAHGKSKEAGQCFAHAQRYAPH